MSEEIRKIMEREGAIKLLDSFKLKVCGVDLEKLCSDDELIEEAEEKLKQKDKSETEERAEILMQKYRRTLENAVMCGLIFWNDEKDCLCQKLVRSVASGDQSCDVLQYANQLCLNDVKNQSNDTTQVLIDNLSKISGRSKQVVSKIGGVDVDIAMACISFFGM